jgi:hypothetical protein
MKKILFISAFAACAAMGMSSCMNGDYDANPDTVNTGGNPLTPVNPGGGGGNSNDPAYYSWNGTDPVSAKIDGAAYQATGAMALDLSGIITLQASGGGKMVQVMFPSATANGTILECNSTSTNIITVDNNYTSATGSGGKIYVIENDATHCKGKFFGNLKMISGGGNMDVTEGYFNVTK